MWREFKEMPLKDKVDVIAYFVTSIYEKFEK